MNTKQLDLIFKSLRYSYERLLDIDDNIETLEIKLNGVVKQNPAEVITLEARLETLSYERNYHLYTYKVVEKCLKTVNDQELQILELYYWYNQTYKTIALALGCDESTIRKKIDKLLQNFLDRTQI